MATFREQNRRDDEPAERISHGEPEFLCTEIGWDHEWVWCPLCHSRPDGWWENGQPKWTGGAIEAAVPVKNSTELQDVIVACRCSAGQTVQRSLGTRYFDNLAPAAVFATTPLIVLWRRGVTAGSPPVEEPRPGSAAYNAGMATQFRRHLAGEITYAQFTANAATLERKHMPPRLPPVTISQILQSAQLMQLYYPRPESIQEPQPAGNSGLPYKD